MSSSKIAQESSEIRKIGPSLSDEFTELKETVSHENNVTCDHKSASDAELQEKLISQRLYYNNCDHKSVNDAESPEKFSQRSYLDNYYGDQKGINVAESLEKLSQRSFFNKQPKEAPAEQRRTNSATEDLIENLKREAKNALSLRQKQAPEAVKQVNASDALDRRHHNSVTDSLRYHESFMKQAITGIF